MSYPNTAARHLRPVNGDEPAPVREVHAVDPDKEAREIARARSVLPPIDPAAFDCYLGQLVDTVAEFTEGDPLNVLVSLLCATGVHLGQGPHVRAGDDVHPLLVWPLIVGRTNSGRKGSGWASAKRLLTAAAGPEFARTNLKSGLTSGEGLAAMFTDDPDEHATLATNGDPDTAAAARRAGGRLPPGDRRLLVFEPEWAGVMARMKREGNSLSATLRAAWEGGDLSTLAVTARIAPTSHIGILAHITPEEFRAKVSASDLAGGTYNRFLPVMVSRARFLPAGQGAPAHIVDRLALDLRGRLDHGGKAGAFGFTGAGARLWAGLYVEFGSDNHDDTPQVQQFTSRAAPNCLRIAAIHAALDGTDTIDTHHLHAAAALVRYSIDSARAALSNNQEVRKLADYIAAAGTEGRTRKAITTEHFGGHKKAAEIGALLDKLTATGSVTLTKVPPAGGRGGRATEVYTARTPELAN